MFNFVIDYITYTFFIAINFNFIMENMVNLMVILYDFLIIIIKDINYYNYYKFSQLERVKNSKIIYREKFIYNNQVRHLFITNLYFNFFIFHIQMIVNLNFIYSSAILIFLFL